MSQPTIIIEGFGQSAVHNIYCIGRNYEEHAKELGNPVPKGEPIVFLKTSSCLRPLSGGPLAFPDDVFHHEAELVLRIGQHVPMGRSIGWETIDAVSLGLDMTRREIQTGLKAKGLPWTTAKSFAGSAIVAPFIHTSELGGQTAFEFTLDINGERKQSGHTNQMIFDVQTILTWLSSFNVLLPGDLVFTGTPSGVGPMRKGDAFTLELKTPRHIWHGVL